MKVRFSLTDPQELIDPYLSDVAASIARSKRIMIITGAGISCNSGIPDFRSTDGLYNLVKAKHPGVVLRGQELFDATLFKDEKTTRCFYTFMAELKRLIDQAQPTPTHDFIRSIQDKNQLMRCYTQNIDCLEDGFPVVQLHGSMAQVKCTLCPATYDFTDLHQDQFRAGTPPICPQCDANDQERQRLGKRSLATGTLRPAIVLYNEAHPNGESIGSMQASDLKKRPDLLIVMGTSLKIGDLKKYIKLVAKSIHTNHPRTGRVIFVNKTKATKEWESVFDYEVLGDADTWVNLTDEKLLDTKAMAAAKTRLREAIKREEEQDRDDYFDDDKENLLCSRSRKRLPSSKKPIKSKKITKPLANQTIHAMVKAKALQRSASTSNLKSA
ncbi:DHS-like NAD/FAD-binding domain-containing protein [Hesseltinella vesiculosa]|uniref:DHS-like NAD/FAD-binding domain-containing protein n=1 Tax=Hesseltinella vesiculosa TaxID=101127 RepID=A0A1X2GH55_9FUNG|nr:DHS-like NAD/FAD-binding domain-containing protein [Hesseltinella vesiculosa]